MARRQGLGIAEANSGGGNTRWVRGSAEDDASTRLLGQQPVAGWAHEPTALRELSLVASNAGVRMLLARIVDRERVGRAVFGGGKQTPEPVGTGSSREHENANDLSRFAREYRLPPRAHA